MEVDCIMGRYTHRRMYSLMSSVAECAFKKWVLVGGWLLEA